jgi:hypothetical protein
MHIYLKYYTLSLIILTLYEYIDCLIDHNYNSSAILYRYSSIIMLSLQLLMKMAACL